MLLVRRNVPESPRWLFIHGREEEAERIVDEIERGVSDDTGEQLPEPDGALTIHQRQSIGFREIAQVAFTRYPRRAVLGLALFVGQAFLYNAVTFNLRHPAQQLLRRVAGAIVPAVLRRCWAAGNFARAAAARAGCSTPSAANR